MEGTMCKCGAPALFNVATQEWELCAKCRAARMGSYDFDNIIERMGFGKKYRGANLSMFDKQFVDSMFTDTNNFSKNLLLTGDSSVGKTQLMAGIVRDLLQKGYTENDVRYTNTIRLYMGIGADITNVGRFVEDLGTAPVVCLDEIAPHKTEWEYRTLYMILEDRKNAGLLTISASNCSLDKLDGRIVSRLVDGGVQYRMTRKVWNT